MTRRTLRFGGTSGLSLLAGAGVAWFGVVACSSETDGPNGAVGTFQGFNESGETNGTAGAGPTNDPVEPGASDSESASEPQPAFGESGSAGSVGDSDVTPASGSETGPNPDLDNGAGGSASSIDDGSGNANGNASGSANVMAGAAGATAGAAGASMMPADPSAAPDAGVQNPPDPAPPVDDPTEPEPPPNVDPPDPEPPVIVDPPEPEPPPVDPPEPPAGASTAEMEAYFAELPCGARYTALGDGGWQFCLRLSDGGAACTRGSAEFQRVTLAGGGAVTDVAQVSGLGNSSVGVVTTDGALLVGGVTSISTDPTIASGVVQFSGGFHAQVALLEAGQGFRVQSWSDGGQPADVTLPGGAEPIQVAANYGIACALTTTGSVYCWDEGGNHSLGLTDTPTQMDMAPVRQISAGQNSVCGVTFDDALDCDAAWYDNPFLPTEPAGSGDFQVRQSTFPAVRDVTAGFRQGIVVEADGTAFFLGGVGAGSDNPGQLFEGVSGVVASGGDRGAACVQDAGGAVFCQDGGGTARATLGGTPLVAAAANCPL